jgi:MoaA/NifB/PqqE/SkfB family radical SAM enzyme
VKIFKNLRGRIRWLNLTGGEPFLRDDLYEIVFAAIRIMKPLFINIPTNGLLPQQVENLVRKIERHCVKNTNIVISVSVDDIYERDDNLRGVSGAYKMAIETFNILSSSKIIEAYFQVNISGYNIGHIEEVIEELLRHKKIIITFAHKMDLFRNFDTTMTIENFKSEAIKFIDKYISRFWRINGFDSVVFLMYLKGMRYFLLNGKLPVRCTAGISTLTIDPFGNVLPCPYKIKSVLNVRDCEYNPLKYYTGAVKKRVLLENYDCNLCWQNCEAIPSILLHPIKSLSRLL